MLSELSIQNFAIIDKLSLRFDPGFSVLTGETGAGKSIIIDAVGMLLGGRGGADLVRSGAERALMEGIFLLDGEMQELIDPLIEQEGLEGDDPHSLTLARELRRTGRHVCRVNGRAVSLKVLSGIGEHLVDIHGQTEHLSLLRVREHLELLDRYGNALPVREQVGRLVLELRSVRAELAGLRRDERELARRMDLLQYQVAEIHSAHLQVGEEEELLQERSRLGNAERLTSLADEAYLVLFEGGDDQAPAVDLVQTAAQSLGGLVRLDASTSSLGERAATASYELEDLARAVREYRDGIEANPKRLEAVEDRLNTVRTLQRKYGDSIEDVLAFAAHAQRDLETISRSEERVEELEVDEERLLHQIGQLGSELSELRQAAGERLAQGIEAELEELSMSGARFGVDLSWRDVADGAYVGGRRVSFSPTGLDRAEFLVAPNVGEPLKPLVRIASGGETSRLMLALKTVLAQADRTPTLIFDEIDAGIGGRVGAVVGRKLWGLTEGHDGEELRHQVLCVTHLPQLAGYGDLHLQVAKRVIGKRTVTQVRSLEAAEREEELAGMLGTVTPKTIASAHEMLGSSQKEKGRQAEAGAQYRPGR